MSHGMISTGPNYAQLSALGSANGSEECSSTSQAPYLGVEELMVLLSSRLNDLDSEIREKMGMQADDNARRKALSEFANAMGNMDKVDQGRWDEMQKKFDEIMGSLDPEDHTYQWMAAQREKMANELANDAGGEIGPGRWKTFAEEVRGEATSIGDTSEIQMLTIQSDMTKRTTLVQLITNIVQKLEAAPDMIAKNI